jgi:hypothetical protein
MPIGPYPDYPTCIAAQIEIYRKKHPDWAPEHLKTVAGGVCYTIEQNMKGAIDAEDLTFLQGKLSESDLNIDNVWGTHDEASKRMNEYFDEYERQRKANPTLSRDEIWNLTAHTFKQASQAHKYHYYASMHSPYQKDGKFYALFRVISTKPSGMTWPKGERWRPSYESLRRCLGSIFKAPLIGPPSQGHLATMQHGRPVSWTMPNGYADVVFEVDKTAYDKLESGEWHDVSPQINPITEHREGDVAVVDDWTFEHVAFVNKGAFEDVEALDWWQGDPKKWLALAAEFQSHAETGSVDPSLRLMTDGAPNRLESMQGADETNTPKGGISLTNESSPDSNTYQGASAWDTADAPDKFFAYVPAEASGLDGKKSLRKIPLASVEKKDLDPDIVRNAVARLPQADIPSGDLADVRAKIRSAAHSLGLELPSLEGEGATGGTPKMNDKESSQTPEKTPDKTKENEAEVQRLQAELAQANQRIEIAQKAYKPPEAWQAEFNGLKKEVQDLREDRQRRLDAERSAKIDKLTDLRIRGNLASDTERVEEAKKYTSLSAEALDLMIADAEVVAAQVESGGPKAQFHAAKSGDSMLETVGKRMFGSSFLGVEKKEEK